MTTYGQFHRKPHLAPLYPIPLCPILICPTPLSPLAAPSSAQRKPSKIVAHGEATFLDAEINTMPTLSTLPQRRSNPPQPPSPETRQHVESSSCVNKNIRLIDVSYSALRRASNFQRDNLLLGRVRGCWEIERRERPRCQKTESSV